MSKPLPPISAALLDESDKGDTADIDDDASMVMVESSSSGLRSIRSSSPDRTIKSKSPVALPRVSSRTKRWSTSTDEVDSDEVAHVANTTSRISPSKVWDSNISGVMKDFTGQLSEQLDGISASSLDLKDPSTPKRFTFDSTDSHDGLAVNRPEMGNGPISSVAETINGASDDFRVSASASVSSLDDSPNSLRRGPTPVEDAIVPPRLSSLYTPLKSPHSSAALGQASRGNSIKYGPRQQRPGSGNLFGSNRATVGSSTLGRDNSRLRVMHKSSASSSEPALIPIRDDDRSHENKRTVRLVPSSPAMGWPEATSPALSVCLSSQTDLTSGDGSNSRLASSAPSRDELSQSDLAARAKDLATKCWTEDEDFLPKEKIAEWLGGM